MSARYSNSHSLHLPIADSIIYRALHAALCLLAMFSLYRIDQRGYTLLAVILLPIACLCCWRLARQSLAGDWICWHMGQWSVATTDGSTPVVLQRSSCTPWVIYLAWIDHAGGRRGSAFLFPDSATSQNLRRLRVRLVLER